ncbi:hypothetical protein CSC36_6093 [Pseudomonas aeruginosa]|nr:hypothetical protein CSC36_6093 [Pseudomonas aeruginosa]
MRHGFCFRLDGRPVDELDSWPEPQTGHHYDGFVLVDPLDDR